MDPQGLYHALAVGPDASQRHIKQSYKRLLTRLHPDKGGSPSAFQAIQKAYDVLSNPQKKQVYDETGKVLKTADEQFAEQFAGGAFSSFAQHAQPDAHAQLALRQPATSLQSHTDGFEAWLRSRNALAADVITADKLAEQLGVDASSYNAVPIVASDGAVTAVQCSGPGEPLKVLSITTTPLPSHLQWGEVLVKLLLSPINPSDLYTARTGGHYGATTAQALPYTAGHDGVALVLQVGAGVAGLAPGDTVLPGRPHMGCWTSLAVWQERDTIKLPRGERDHLPLELLACCRQACTAYVLLEGSRLRAGDALILNAATSLTGRLLVQLAAVLRLRAIAVVADHGAGSWEEAEQQLRGLGAAAVLRNGPGLRDELTEWLRYSAKPRLALDAVGGESAVRLAGTLAEGGELVVYGCMGGRPVVWPWQAWVFDELRVRGFNAFRWMAQHRGRVTQVLQELLAGLMAAGRLALDTTTSACPAAVPPGGLAPAVVVGQKVLQELGELMAAGRLALDHTEYDLAGGDTLQDALEHALAQGKATKVMLSLGGAGPGGMGGGGDGGGLTSRACSPAVSAEASD